MADSFWSWFRKLSLKAKLTVTAIWLIIFVTIFYFVYGHIDCSKSFWDFWYSWMYWIMKCDYGILSEL